MIRTLAIMIFAILLGCNEQQPTAERIIDATKIQLTAEERQYVENHRIVTWGVEENRPPSIYITKNGEVKGRVPLYLSLIEKKTGLVFRPMPVESLSHGLVALERGQINLMTSVRPTPDRLKYMAFTVPFANNGAVFLFRDTNVPNSPLGIGIQKSDAGIIYLKERFPGIKIFEINDNVEALHLLQREILDLVMMDESTADFLIKYHKLKIRKVKTDYYYPSSFGYSKDNKILGSILTKAILSMSVEDRVSMNDAWQKEKLERDR